MCPASYIGKKKGAKANGKRDSRGGCAPRPPVVPRLSLISPVPSCVSALTARLRREPSGVDARTKGGSVLEPTSARGFQLGATRGGTGV